MKYPQSTLLVAAMASVAWAQTNPKLAKELESVPPDSTVNVIAQYRVKPTESHHARAHRVGATENRRFAFVHAAAYNVPASALEELSHDPDLAHISVDHVIKARLDVAAKTINADVLWEQGYSGSGITVAVIDSGINDGIQDLGNASGQTDPNHSRVIWRENFLYPATNPDGSVNNQHYRTRDAYGHGTHVAGIIAGNGFQSLGQNFTTTYKGIAPKVNLIDFQVLDGTGSGTDSAVIAALDEAISLKSKYNIRVINLSLGRPVYDSFASDPLCQAVEAAWQAGIVVVVAAGNDGRDNTYGENGYGTINAPGNDPFVITVGAMNSKFTAFRNDDVVTTYTSKGPTPVDHIVKPDLMAPGNHISSLLDNGAYLPQTYPSNIVNQAVYTNGNGKGDYFVLNGTSMATGVVSGAVADLLSFQPGLTPDQVKALLMLTASKSFYTYSDAYYSRAADAYGTAAQLTSAQQQLQQAQGQLGPLQGRLQQATQQLQQNQQQLNAATATYQSSLQQITILQQQLAQAQASYNAAQQQQAAQQQANALQGLVNQLQGNLQNAQNQAQQRLQQMNQASSAVQSSQAALSGAQAALASLQTNISSLQSQVQALGQPGSALQAQLAQMQSDPTQATSTQYDVFTVGAGLIDLNAAMQNAGLVPANSVAVSPFAYIDQTTGEVAVTGDYATVCATDSTFAATDLCSSSSLVVNLSASWNFSTILSGTRSVWGAQSIWGDSAFVDSMRSVWGAQSIWGSRSVWGASSTQAFRSVWGARSMWGASVSGADSTDSAESILVNGDN
jgi:serine protease AprX